MSRPSGVPGAGPFKGRTPTMGYTGYVELSEAHRIVARAIEAGLRYRLVNVGNGVAFVSVFTRSEEGELNEVVE